MATRMLPELVILTVGVFVYQSMRALPWSMRDGDGKGGSSENGNAPASLEMLPRGGLYLGSTKSSQEIGAHGPQETTDGVLAEKKSQLTEKDVQSVTRQETSGAVLVEQKSQLTEDYVKSETAQEAKIEQPTTDTCCCVEVKRNKGKSMWKDTENTEKGKRNWDKRCWCEGVIVTTYEELEGGEYEKTATYRCCTTLPSSETCDKKPVNTCSKKPETCTERAIKRGTCTGSKLFTDLPGHKAGWKTGPEALNCGKFYTYDWSTRQYCDPAVQKGRFDDSSPHARIKQLPRDWWLPVPEGDGRHDQLTLTQPFEDLYPAPDGRGQMARVMNGVEA